MLNQKGILRGRETSPRGCLFEYDGYYLPFPAFLFPIPPKKENEKKESKKKIKERYTPIIIIINTSYPSVSRRRNTRRCSYNREKGYTRVYERKESDNEADKI